MNTMEQIKNRHWSKHYRRYFNIHRLDLCLKHMQPELEKFVGYGMDTVLALGDGYDVRWYFDEDQFDQLAQAVADTTWQDAKQSTDHIQNMKHYAEEGIMQINTYDTNNFTAYTKGQLAKAHQKFLKAADHIVPILYTGVVTDRQLFEQARAVLQKKYQGAALEQAFETIITPIKPTPISQEELDLCALRLDGEHDEKKLRHHQQRYRWVGMQFVEQRPRSIADIEQELCSIDPQTARQKIDAVSTQLRTQKQALKNIVIRFDETDARFLLLVNTYSMFRHERDVYRGALYYYGHYLYVAIASHYEVSVDSLLSYTISEFILLLEKGVLLSDNEIAQRKKRFGFVMLKNNIRLITSDAALDQIETVVAAPATYDHALRGTPAQRGYAQGVVRVVRPGYAPDDLTQVQQNEILVAYSTNPEYVPAMKKAAAILTEEGGVTCHAAIVSRELGVPSIVGIPGLTGSLKSGDRVEVDAQRGIVRKQ